MSTLAIVCAILFLGFVYIVQHDGENWLAGLTALALFWAALALGWAAL